MKILHWNNDAYFKGSLESRESCLERFMNMCISTIQLELALKKRTTREADQFPLMYIIRRLSYYLPLHGKSRCVLFDHLKRRNAKGNSNFFLLCDVHYVKPTQKPFKTSLWQKEWKMNIGLIFQNEFYFIFLLKMNHSTNLQNISALICWKSLIKLHWVQRVQETAYETDISESKLTESTWDSVP